MRTNSRKQSGLDIEALNAKMNALDQKAEKEKEVQQEAVDLQELAEELRQVASDVRCLVPKVRELSASMSRPDCFLLFVPIAVLFYLLVYLWTPRERRLCIPKAS